MRGTSEPHWEVVYAGTDLAVTRLDIDAYLRDGSRASPEFRVYGIRYDNFQRYLSVARRKGHEIGLEFTWDRIADYAVAQPDELPFLTGQQPTILQRFGRPGSGADNLCEIPVLGIHRYDNQSLNGQTSRYRPPTETNPSGVSFRERTPEFIFQWVLIHELGHYFGLDHAGHDGAENIMFVPSASEGLDWVTPETVAEYLVWTGEPRFTLDDARVVWDWLTANAPNCIRGT